MAALHRIIEDVKKLSPDECRQLQSVLATPQVCELNDALSAKLRDLGLVQHPRRRAAQRRTRPPLIRVTGKPVSQTLIEERR